MVVNIKIKVQTRTESGTCGDSNAPDTHIATWRDLQATSDKSTADAARKLKALIQKKCAA